MISKSEVISIVRCPLCTESHTYDLSVSRSIVMKMTVIDTGLGWSNLRSFTRIFPCPNKHEDFQATIKLEESSSESIDEVRVSGIASSRV